MSQIMVSGHIKIDRKILNWEWYRDIKMFHLFLYLLLKANFKDGKWQGYVIKRGQVITGRLKISADTGLSEREIRTCLNKLKTTNEITIKTTNKYSIITICKYDIYQSQSESKDQQKDTQIDQQTTNKRPTNDQQTTTIEEEYNKDNKEKKEIIYPYPNFSELNGLPDIKNGSIIELLRITRQVNVSKEQIDGLWNVFKVQNLTGKKYYKDEDEVHTHFMNWCKIQNFDKQVKNERKLSSYEQEIEDRRNKALGK